MKYEPITVSELNTYIKGKIEEDEFLEQVLVKGEISNFKHHYTCLLYTSKIITILPNSY